MDQPGVDPEETEAEHKARMARLKAEQDAKVRSKTEDRGVLVVHTGPGKGKSTAGFGVAMRAAGHGQRVAVVQFIKGAWKTGEEKALRRFPEITWLTAGDGFTWNTQDKAKDIASAEGGWAQARRFVESGDCDVVVLDELCVALSYGFLQTEAVVAVLRARPPHVSVVVTGRGAPPELIEAADTVTEHVAVKHAFEAGVKARKGVEF